MTPDEQIVMELLQQAVNKYGPGVLFGALGGLFKEQPQLKAEAQKLIAAGKAEAQAEKKASGAGLLLLGALVLTSGKKRGRR